MQARAATPNPSLERNPTGKALGPRGSQCHHPPRGPSALPAAAAQLKRWAASQVRMQTSLLSSNVVPRRWSLRLSLLVGQARAQRQPRRAQPGALALALIASGGVVANDLRLLAFDFSPPAAFAPIPKAAEAGILRFYGNQRGDSINVSDYQYLRGRELTKEVCAELVSLFDSSPLRASLSATSARSTGYGMLHGSRSCYYSYEFQRLGGVTRVDYRVCQSGDLRSYAISAVYDTKSPDIAAIHQAMTSFKIR